jgi:hypothetical protein
MLGGGTWWPLQKFLQYIVLELTPSTILLPTIPIPEILSAGVIFPFAYMCSHYLHCIHSPMPFPHPFPLLLLPSPRQGINLFEGIDSYDFGWNL